jgi:hypothetical protein
MQPASPPDGKDGEMANFVGLTDYDTLGRGGQNIAQQADALHQRLRALIAELAPAPDAMQGGQLAAFNRAATELTMRFDELIRWATLNATKLGESQTVVTTSDQTSQEQYAAAGGQLGGLSRPL